MSNATVGNVYHQVIRDVIESSRVDFEEGGVDESVLEELSRGWQKKLSQLNIAQFPWDPKPEQTSASSSMQQQQPINTHYDMSSSQPNVPLSNVTIPQASGPRIKTEPGSENSGLVNQPNYPQPAIKPFPGATAQQMAAMNLQQQFGARASQSIDALGGIPSNIVQAQQSQQIPPQTQPRMQMPQYIQNNQQSTQQQKNGQQNPRAMNPADYAAAMRAQTEQQRLHMQGQNASTPDIKFAQNDGAADNDSGILNAIDAEGKFVEIGRVQIDALIRSKIEANGRAMEGGGLMLPLSARPKKLTSTINRKRVSGGDAADDDDDVKSDPDEDAINSDLDDPDDDNLNEEEEEDAEGANMMLCMYDKVQRVKNKWKCVMKDGVITIDGKEYVFHKATGEYEW